MTRALLFSAAILTSACGHDGRQLQTQHDTSSAAAPAQPAAGIGSEGRGPTGTTGGARTSAVTLVGCLQEPARAGATGTAGSAASRPIPERETGSVATSAHAHDGEANARFTLIDATVESGDGGANGTNSPVPSSRSSFALDGVPADAQASVNKQVRVTGRIDRTDVRAETSTAAGSASTRDDVRANSTTVASGAPNNASPRHVSVDGVQVIAESCPAR